MPGADRSFRASERRQAGVERRGGASRRQRSAARAGRGRGPRTAWKTNRRGPAQKGRGPHPERYLRQRSHRRLQAIMTGAPSTRTAIAGQPLAGWRVLITRATRQSGGLAGPLRDLGAEVLEIPTIRIDPPASFAPLDEVLRKIRDYDWLLLTSVNGVEALFERLEKLALSKDRLRHLQVAAIGPATRRAIEERGLSVAMTPPKYVAEAVADMLRDPTRGKRVLLVRAKVARDVLPIELRKSGALVDVIEAYETKVPEGAEQRLREIFSGPRAKPDVVTFTSSSTAN